MDRCSTMWETGSHAIVDKRSRYFCVYTRYDLLEGCVKKSADRRLPIGSR